MKKFTKEYFLDALVVVIAASLSTFYIAHGDLTTYIATPMAIADKGIFRQDFSIVAFLSPNAQSISDLFVAIFLRLGMSWQTFAVIGTIITSLVFGAGIIAISKHFMKKNSFLMSGFFMLLCLFSLSGLRIGRNQIWTMGFYYSQLAYCMAIWAFYWALKGKWKRAFILIPIATLFHFTVGSYSAAFLVVFLLIDVVKNKEYKKLMLIIPWIAVCFGIFAMMFFTGSTSTGLMSNEMFVKIHCYLRHPHHHVPSSWEKVEWFNFISYIIGIYLLLLTIRKKSDEFKKLNKLFLVSTGFTALILLGNYLFIEIYPLAFVAKLQPARSVFIYRTLLAGVLAYIIAFYWNEKKFGIGALIALTACIPQVINTTTYASETYSGFYILAIGALALIIYLAEKWNFGVIAQLAPVGYFLVFSAYVIRARNVFNAYDIYYKFIAFTAMMYVFSISITKNSRKITKALRTVLIIGAAALTVFLPWFDIHSKQIRTADSMFNSATSYELRALAEEFKENTDEDAIFFGDPMNAQTAYFRLYSERNSVVAFKNMPFTDDGMIEWVQRLTDCDAIEMKDDGYYRTNEGIFKNSYKTPYEKQVFCNMYGAEYLYAVAGEETLQEYLDEGYTIFLNKGSSYIFNVPK